MSPLSVARYIDSAAISSDGKQRGKKKEPIDYMSLWLKTHLLVNKPQSDGKKETSRLVLKSWCPDPEISDEQISGICVFEDGEGCGGGVG